jgi:ribosomal protein L29
MANDRMAKQEREEFAGLDAAGLRARLDEEKRKHWQNGFDLGKRSLTNTAELAKSRKRMARIHTYLHQLELKETEA